MICQPIPHTPLVRRKLVRYNNHMSKRALEQYRIFPYIAWTLVGGFAFFVYTLTTELTRVTTELEVSQTHLEIMTNQDPATITDFTR